MNIDRRFGERLGPPLIVYTFGRSGTHMIIDLVRRQFPAFASWKWPGTPNAYLYGSIDAREGSRCIDLMFRRLLRPRRPIIMTHDWAGLNQRLQDWSPSAIEWLDRGCLLHVVRNPIHAIESSWPILVSRARSNGETFLSPLEFVQICARRWVGERESLRGRPHTLIRYETAKADPRAVVSQISAAIGERPVMIEPLMAKPYRSKAASRIGRLGIRPASTAVVASQSVRRRYRLEWTPPLRAALASIVGKKMAELGYAMDFDRLTAPHGVSTAQMAFSGHRLVSH